ncbi:MAG: hypothetical protein ACE5JO_09125 [Candidatus Binatia bacterium]
MCLGEQIAAKANHVLVKHEERWYRKPLHGFGCYEETTMVSRMTATELAITDICKLAEEVLQRDSEVAPGKWYFKQFVKKLEIHDEYNSEVSTGVNTREFLSLLRIAGPILAHAVLELADENERLKLRGLTKPGQAE